MCPFGRTETHELKRLVLACCAHPGSMARNTISNHGRCTYASRGEARGLQPRSSTLALRGLWFVGGIVVLITSWRNRPPHVSVSILALFGIQTLASTCSPKTSELTRPNVGGGQRSLRPFLRSRLHAPKLAARRDRRGSRFAGPHCVKPSCGCRGGVTTRRLKNSAANKSYRRTDLRAPKREPFTANFSIARRAILVLSPIFNISPIRP
jgi:hypothetical protein